MCTVLPRVTFFIPLRQVSCSTHGLYWVGLHSYIRTAGQEALYARFWILPLEGAEDTKGKGLWFWWGLGEGT